MIDASTVSMPKQNDSGAENAAMKAGETLVGWSEKPATNHQTDTEPPWMPWTKKHGKAHYDYKNSTSVDRLRILSLRYMVTNAPTQDSQVIEDTFDDDITSHLL